MFRQLNFILFGALFLYSCTQQTDTKIDVATLALEEYLLTSTEYFPLENLLYLENIKKKSINERCNINIDSLKEKFYISNNFNSGDISNYKLKSIYLDALMSCYSTAELTVNLIKVDAASDWSSEMFSKYYNQEMVAEMAHEVNINELAGLPFEIENIKSVKQDQDSIYNSCVKYLKISPVFKVGEYFYIELINGCFGRGENKTLYVFRHYKNRYIIDNKIQTQYKY